MKQRFIATLLQMALCVALGSTALASTAWYVNGVSGSNSNNCKSSTAACKTIGHAISLAVARDSIMVAAATYKENLTIGISLTIVGAGASTTIIDGGRVHTVVTIPSTSAQVTLSKVTIRNGRSKSGGGVYNSGALRIIDSTLSGNEAYAPYSGAVSGGGIYNSGTLTVIDSTLSQNSAFYDLCRFRGCSADGGGIFNGGSLTIINSTLSSNSANVGCYVIHCDDFGGGISSGGTLTIANSTLSSNSTSHHHGDGIYNRGTAILRNSILANTPSLYLNNCDGTMTSNGYNMSSDSSCNFSSSGDWNNTDPKLGPLQNNGGPTQTTALLPGSPAIDAGNPSGCTDAQGHLLTTDQRGMPRPDKEDKVGCDMGAYERQSD